MNLASLMVYMVLNGFDVYNDIWGGNELPSWCGAYEVAAAAAAILTIHCRCITGSTAVLI